VHTTPPFYLHDANPQEKLVQCYQSSLEAAFHGTLYATIAARPNSHSTVRVAVPLLGSGARGFPADVAMAVAAQAVAEAWLAPPALDKRENDGDEGPFETVQDDVVQHTVAFGLLEESLAEQMSVHLNRAFDKRRPATLREPEINK
jgi:Macro domain